MYLLLQLLCVEENRIGYHYMGASEFEWGSIPAAYRALNKAFKAGELRTGTFERKELEVKSFRVNTKVSDVKLWWAALPTANIPGGGSDDREFDMNDVLEKVVTNEARGHESFYLPEIFVTRKLDGWLSVPTSYGPGSATEPLRGYIFFAMSSQRGFDLVMEKVRTFKEKSA